MLSYRYHNHTNRFPNASLPRPPQCRGSSRPVAINLHCHLRLGARYSKSRAIWSPKLAGVLQYISRQPTSALLSKTGAYGATPKQYQTIHSRSFQSPRPLKAIHQPSNPSLQPCTTQPGPLPIAQRNDNVPTSDTDHHNALCFLCRQQRQRQARSNYSHDGHHDRTYAKTPSATLDTSTTRKCVIFVKAVGPPTYMAITASLPSS